MVHFKCLNDLLIHFADPKVCWDYLEQRFWKGEPICPHCKSYRVYRLKNYKQFKCGNKATCDKKFTVLTDTIFENTKIPLQKWIAAIYLITQHKKGVSSVQIARDLGITQKSAWFMVHRIRKMVTPKQREKVGSKGNPVCVDETYCGGAIGNMSKYKRKLIAEGRLIVEKIPVIGFVEPNGNAILQVVKDRTRKNIIPLINRTVAMDSVIVTDCSKLYTSLDCNPRFGGHIIINHSNGEYVNGDYTTNPVESFFACLKRSIYGVYHSVSVKHLQRYCEETSWRYNTRKLSVSERFNKSFEEMKGHMRYIDLIEKK